MSRRALIAGALAVVIGGAYLLFSRSSPPPVKVALESPADAGTAFSAVKPVEAKKENGKEKEEKKEPPPPPEPPEPQEPPELEEKDDPLVGLELEEPTSAELTELKMPEGMTGVVVKKVDPASPAAEAKLQKGDVIVRAQRDKITDERSLRAAIGDRDHTVLTVYRHGYPFQVVLHKPFHAEP